MEDREYLPSIQKAKLEKERKMPDNIEHIEEDMKFKDPLETDLDDIEKRVDELQETMSEDREEPMTIERKIHMLGKIFPYTIGDHVRNALDEHGVIDLVGLDSRGVIYGVQYPNQILMWQSENQISKIPSNLTTQINEKEQSTIKTDIEE